MNSFQKHTIYNSINFECCYSNNGTAILAQYKIYYSKLSYLKHLSDIEQKYNARNVNVTQVKYIMKQQEIRCCLDGIKTYSKSK